MNELVEAQIKRMMNLAHGCLSKEVADLTEDERCALAWCAGCEMECAHQETTADSIKFRYTTKNPIGIVKIDGKFRVAECVPNEMERLRRLGLLHFDD